VSVDGQLEREKKGEREMTNSSEGPVAVESLPDVTPLGHPNYPIGRISRNKPFPPLEESTKYFSAGKVTLGFEHRILTEALVRETFPDDANRIAELTELGFPDDDGLSIHVIETSTQREYVRFDMFPEYEHYHYMPDAPYHYAISYDAHANGNMFDWATNAISNHLASMLHTAGAHELAEGFDVDAVRAAVQQVQDYADTLSG
jgi:hypothetical protein